MSSVDEVLTELKAHFRLETDAQLAKRLKVGHSTISTWKARGSVPRRYRDMLISGLELTVGTGPIYWGEYENAAFGIAITRYTRTFMQAGYSSDFAQLLSTTNGVAGFWTILGETQNDLRDQLDRGGVELKDAVSILLNDDLMDVERAAARDTKRVEDGRSSVEFEDGMIVKY